MITSPKNSKIQEAKKLQRKRRRYTASQLLLEGVRLLDDAIGAGVRPETVFYVPELLSTTEGGRELLQRIQSLHVSCLACSSAAFAPLSETVSPQGIAAVVAMPSIPPPQPLDRTLLLDGVGDPGNAGTLLRSAEAAGVDAVIFAPGTVDPFNDKVLRAAMGAHFRLSLIICETWTDVEKNLSSQQTLYVAEATASLPYDQVDWRQPSVLIVGNEAAGPSAWAAHRAQEIAIPMLGSTESLNAGIAGAVILFEAARQRRQSKKP